MQLNHTTHESDNTFALSFTGQSRAVSLWKYEFRRIWAHDQWNVVSGRGTRLIIKQIYLVKLVRIERKSQEDVIHHVWKIVFIPI